MRWIFCNVGPLNKYNTIFREVKTQAFVFSGSFCPQYLMSHQKPLMSDILFVYSFHLFLLLIGFWTMTPFCSGSALMLFFFFFFHQSGCRLSSISVAISKQTSLHHPPCCPSTSHNICGGAVPMGKGELKVIIHWLVKGLFKQKCFHCQLLSTRLFSSF